jgi:hypothetical protein
MGESKKFGTPRIIRVLALLMLFFLPGIALGQNCALCYTQAAGSGSRVIRALRSGILILVFPPTAISVGIAVMAYKKRNQFNAD